MTSKDIKTVELIVNSDQAKAKLEELNKKLDTMKQKREDALNRGDFKALSVYTREVNKLEKEIQRTETRAQGMSKALANLDKSTPNELQRTLRELTRELNSGKIERGSKEWDALTEAIRSTKDALRDVNEEMATSDNRSFSDKLADWGNKWFGLIENIETFSEVLGSVRETLHEVVNDFATMEEAQAQVRKYTGLSAEAVDELNESLRAMDTRTSRERLNELAGDAGKLGITATDKILEFVEAADKINVALGDDLGDGAVKNVGKLAMLFEEDQRLGLKEAMLSTASVINELSQNSSAGAHYLEDFTARVAGVGKQAGMTQAQIMGFAAVLDENMQQDETSATAFSQLITKMHQEQAKFAALSGKDLQTFSKLLKEDVNQALLDLFQTMKAKGGFDQLAPMFTEMGLEGSRATAVLSSITDKLDDVRRMQDLANISYAEATSINREFNVQNSTVQAGLDKARKAALDMRIELGEKLQPLAAHMVNTSTLALRALSATIDFVKQHTTAIITLTAMITAYTLAVNASTIATKAKAGALVVANTVSKAYHGTVKALHAAHLLLQVGLARLQGNWARQSALMLDVRKMGAAVAMGWGVLLAAAVALGTAIYQYVKKLKEASELEKMMTDIRKRGAEGIVEEKMRLDALLEVARDETRSLDERKRAIDKLNAIIPDYNGQLDTTTGKYKENKEALDKYIDSLIRRYEIEGAKDKLKEIGKQKAQLAIDRQAAQQEVDKLKESKSTSLSSKGQQTQVKASGRSQMDADLGFVYSTANTTWNNNIKNAEAKVVAIDKKIEEQEKKIQLIKDTYGAELTDNIAAEPTPDEDFGGDGGGDDGGGGSDDDDKAEAKLKADLQRIEDAARAKRIAQMVQYEQGLITTEQYETQLLEIEQAMIEEKMALYEKGSTGRLQLEEQHLSTLRRIRENNYQWSLQDISRQETEAQDAARQSYAKGEINEEQYQRKLDEIRLSHLRKRQQYFEQIGNQEKAQEWKQKADTEDANQTINRRKKYLQQLHALEQEYLKKSIEERQAEEEKLLDELIKQNVIKEEERQKFLAEIRKKYDKERKDEKEEKDKKEGKIKDPLSGNVDGMAGDIIQMGKLLNSLQKKIKDGEATWQDYAAVAVASLGFVNSALSAVSQLFQAEQQAQENAVTQRYDKEIAKVGSHTAKGKKLEEQKQKELAAVKNKYRKKQMSMEIAQAVASTAMAAINAYASASKVNFILGPIAAAMALAAGAIQIAAIKKQHSAEASGYYSGGFTGGSAYRKEAGVVHQGEFVANHLAVNNPNVLPVLQFIDHAQKNNTIASITTADVRRAVGGGGNWAGTSQPKASSSAPVQVIDSSSQRTADAIERLNYNLEAGIRASVSIDGQDGFERQWNRYNQMKKRK